MDKDKIIWYCEKCLLDIDAGEDGVLHEVWEDIDREFFLSILNIFNEKAV